MVVGVCVSQRRTDPKQNVGKGFLQKGLGLVGDSHAGSAKEVSLLRSRAFKTFHKKQEFQPSLDLLLKTSLPKELI